MRTWIVVLLLAVGLPLAGCADQAGKPGRGDQGSKATEKKPTGVHVEFGHEGVNVTAPGVGIKVNPEEGVDVTAPGTDVKVHPKDGVDVTAPGTDVEVK